MTSGSLGDIFGTDDWEFLPGWQGRLDSEAIHQVSRLRALVEALPWWELVPDTDAALVAVVAGRRWAVEESFQAGKELAALDEQQVRGWTPWHRRTVLAMLAHAFLTVTAAECPTPSPAGLIPLTCNEIRHLLTTLVIRPVLHAAHRLPWSRWRRDTKRAPRPATTATERPPSNDHDLRLE